MFAHLTTKSVLTSLVRSSMRSTAIRSVASFPWTRPPHLPRLPSSLVSKPFLPSSWAKDSRMFIFHSKHHPIHLFSLQDYSISLEWVPYTVDFVSYRYLLWLDNLYWPRLGRSKVFQISQITFYQWWKGTCIQIKSERPRYLDFMWTKTSKILTTNYITHIFK